jgi:hypothetical protein
VLFNDSKVAVADKVPTGYAYLCVPQGWSIILIGLSKICVWMPSSVKNCSFGNMRKAVDSQCHRARSCLLAHAYACNLPISQRL